ncbi:MAG: hypothetical protein HY884_09235 [Deltaproteobacteria bacterium]|nr:hypothetical protein [Deltaproteobacteria bacterium]
MNIVKLGSYFAVISSAALLLCAGCGKEKKEETPKPSAAAGAGPSAQVPAAGLPGGHPTVDKTVENISQATHSGIKTQKSVRISNEVKAKWKEATLEVADSSSKISETVKIPVGSAVALKNSKFKLKVEVVVPDYWLSADMKIIETRSNEPKNPAALVTLLDGDKTVARGWIFRNLPQYNTFNDTKYSLRLVSPGQGGEAKK